jgi:hypothetical protein
MRRKRGRKHGGHALGLDRRNAMGSQVPAPRLKHNTVSGG